MMLSPRTRISPSSATRASTPGTALPTVPGIRSAFTSAAAGVRPAVRGDTAAGRLRAALSRLNSHLPSEALADALRKVTNPESPSLIENNRRFHHLLTDGVD
ncbi:MAG: hypothetical protein ABR562_09720, partial [Thermoplasmatota archaeon]